MKRGGYLRRRTRLRPVSAKRRVLLSERHEMLAALAELRTGCAAQRLVPAVHCAGRLDPHEPLTRGRGGSVTDEDNVLWICRKHHSWLHRHPEAAHTLGLLVHSWER